MRGLLAHVAITVWWTAVLDHVLPKKNPVVEGAAAGLAIAALDLGVIGRRFPQIRELDAVPQILDHLAFGVVAATALADGTG